MARQRGWILPLRNLPLSSSLVVSNVDCGWHAGVSRSVGPHIHREVRVASYGGLVVAKRGLTKRIVEQAKQSLAKYGRLVPPLGTVLAKALGLGLLDNPLPDRLLTDVARSLLCSTFCRLVHLPRATTFKATIMAMTFGVALLSLVVQAEILQVSAKSMKL